MTDDLRRTRRRAPGTIRSRERRTDDPKLDAYIASLEASLDAVREWSRAHSESLTPHARTELSEITAVSYGVVLARHDEAIREDTLRTVAAIVRRLADDGVYREVASAVREVEDSDGIDSADR